MNPFLSAAINAWIAIASFDFFVGKWRYLFFLGFLCGINILVVFFGGVEDLFVSQVFYVKIDASGE
jgi:hypothetical protein